MYGVDMTPAKQARERKKWTISDVAKRIGMSAASISRIENGKQVASRGAAEKLAKTLGINEQKILYPERFVTRS